MKRVKKANQFTVYKKCSFDLQKKSVERLNFKTKVIDDTAK